MDKVRERDTLMILVLVILAVGVALGSVYMNNIAAKTGEGIQDYLNNFLNAMKQGSDNLSVFKNSLKSNVILLLILFAAGFFRLGIALTAGMIIRKGFVIGFTASSFVKYYGIKGLLIMASMMPGILIVIPAMLIFAAVSADFSLSRDRKDKRKIILYTAAAATTLLMFCLSSLAEGYITTLVMEKISVII